jgi:hypothetical protein
LIDFVQVRPGGLKKKVASLRYEGLPQSSQDFLVGGAWGLTPIALASLRSSLNLGHPLIRCVLTHPWQRQGVYVTSVEKLLKRIKNLTRAHVISYLDSRVDSARPTRLPLSKYPVNPLKRRYKLDSEGVR